MTFRAHFQATQENYSWYFIDLTQMVFLSWALTRFVSQHSWLISKKHNLSSEGLRHSKAVNAPELRNQFQKANYVQNALIIGISLYPPKIEIHYLKDSAFNQISISVIFFFFWSKLHHPMVRGRREEMARDSVMHTVLSFLFPLDFVLHQWSSGFTPCSGHRHNSWQCTGLYVMLRFKALLTVQVRHIDPYSIAGSIPRLIPRAGAFVI